MRCFHRQGLAARASKVSRLSPRRVGNSSQYPRIFGAERSTRSQLLACSACLRYIATMASRPSIAASSLAKRFVASLPNLSTSISSPQSLTSCQHDMSNCGTSSSGVSATASFTTSRVCGTLSPRNSSPSPYWPGPVLKKPMSTCRCFSLRNDSMYPIISLAVIIVQRYTIF